MRRVPPVTEWNKVSISVAVTVAFAKLTFKAANNNIVYMCMCSSIAVEYVLFKKEYH